MKDRRDAWLAERALMNIREALDSYARAHERMYESKLGTDYVLSVPWLQMLRALRDLLNGECGDIDPGKFTYQLTLMRDSHGMSEADETRAAR